MPALVNSTDELFDWIQNDPSVSMNGTDLRRRCSNFHYYFVPLSMLPSVFIILLLSVAERRKKLCECERRLRCLSGRFNLVIPLDFTGKLKNRWSYGFAFGAVTPFVVNLIFSNTDILDLPSYFKLLEVLISALMVSIACMPLFACLSTPHRLLGGVLGLLYSLSWLIAQLWKLISCKGILDLDGFQTQVEGLNNFPQFLCLSFLVVRFGFSIKKGINIHIRNYSREGEIYKHEYRHVQRLLRRPAAGSVQKSWFQRSVYNWDPNFKFPNRIIATVVLSFFGVYMTITTEQVTWSTFVYPWLHILIGLGLKEITALTVMNYIRYTWYISAVCAMLLSLIHISQVLVYYRKHVKALQTGDKKYLPKSYKLDPVYGVMGFLKYPGFQIAFSMWGYLIVHMALLVVGLVFVYLVIYPIQERGFLPWLQWMAMCLCNFFILIALVALQRVLCYMFFLQDKTSVTNTDKPLALKNRTIFHNFNYFFFFFNMMLGVMSCVLRLIKSAAVGLMLVSRIERTIMPEGFEALDSSYCMWVGMIMADHHHTNPVLVCFCHLLLKHTSEDIQEDYSHLNREPLAKNRVHVRWLLLYTLLRNPSLILLRKKRQSKNNTGELAMAWAVLNRA